MTTIIIQEEFVEFCATNAMLLSDAFRMIQCGSEKPPNMWRSIVGKTEIEWCDFSVNPIRARHKTTGAVGHYCELISPGCAHCYSSTLQKRFKMPSFSKKHYGDVEPFMDESKLREVLSRKKPTKFFWEDMSDLFGDWVKDEWIDQCFATMAFTQQHTHQVLTKRPERMRDYVKAISRNYDRLEAGARTLGRTLRFEGLPLVPWPIPSIWLGVSVEDRKHGLPRIDVLRTIPARVRFLSVEPLLEELGEIDLTGISWVIVGGESGHGLSIRRCDLGWIRAIRDQCKAAKVPCFIKQLGRRVSWSGASAPGEHWPNTNAASPNSDSGCGYFWRRLHDKKGGDWSEWPEDLRIREFPKLEAAR